METTTQTEKATLPITFLQLRVLLWSERGIVVGQCLETGNVATADDAGTLKGIMSELLLDEYEHNINGPGSLENFLSTPAPREVWQRYSDLAKNRNADLVGGVNMLNATY